MTSRSERSAGAAVTDAAVLIREFGDPDVLRVGPVRRPALLDGTVLVRTSAAAVSNNDILLRTGAQRRFLDGLTAPYIPGMDLAGVVLESADDRWSPGDRVMAAVSAWRAEGGGQSTVVRVPAASLAATPEQLSDFEASTLPMNGLTAMACLDGLNIRPGGTLAIAGAAGAVGGFAVQLAVARGIRVIADASARDEAAIRGMGADVIVPRGDGMSDAVKEASAGGVDGLIDAALLGRSGYEMVRDGGKVATLRPTADFGLERGITEVKVFVPDHLNDTGILAEISRLAAEGKLAARVAEVYSPHRASDAHRLLEAGGVRGRPVLDMGALA